MTHPYYDTRHKYLSQTTLIQWCTSGAGTLCELDTRWGRWRSVKFLVRAEFEELMKLPEYTGPRHESEAWRVEAVRRHFERIDREKQQEGFV